MSSTRCFRCFQCRSDPARRTVNFIGQIPKLKFLDPKSQNLGSFLENPGPGSGIRISDPRLEIPLGTARRGIFS